MMHDLWRNVRMMGGPLDGATVCVPLRRQRVDHWVWAHECVVFDANNDCWVWAGACMSGFYQLADTAGSLFVDAQDEESEQTYRWRDIRFANASSPHWQMGD